MCVLPSWSSELLIIHFEWSFPGPGEITLTPSSNEVESGNFRALPLGVVGGDFTSTLTFAAESGTVITCINGDRSMNVSQTVTVQGTLEVFHYSKWALFPGLD